MTRTLADEWAPLGINVNAIAPGYFPTKMTAQLDQGATAQMSPIKSWRRPPKPQGRGSAARVGRLRLHHRPDHPGGRRAHGDLNDDKQESERTS